MLVISETLKYDAREGIKVAAAPLLTDAPIILAILWILSALSDLAPVVGAISLAGAGFLSYLGYQSIRFKGTDVDLAESPPRSIRKGILVNFLNPNPYLFWSTIGAPLLAKAMNIGVPSVLSFVIPFYLLLVGMKMALALAVGMSRTFLKSTAYIVIIRGLGVGLFIFAVLFLKNGLADLGLL